MFGLKKSEKTASAASKTAETPATHGSTAASLVEEQGASTPAPRPQRHPQEKKGVPTPSRKEREAQRKRPLVLDPAQAKQRQKEERAAQAEKVREAFRTGDDKYLPFKHKGANRKLIRQVVDEKFRLGETLIFVVTFFLITSFVFANNLALSQILSYIFMGFFALLILEWFLVRRTVKRRQAEAGISPQRGDGFYILERLGMFSKFRVPNKGV